MHTIIHKLLNYRILLKHNIFRLSFLENLNSYCNPRKYTPYFLLLTVVNRNEKMLLSTSVSI